MKGACSKLYGGLPKCSSLLAAARTCFRLLHAYFSIFTRDHTVRTTQPGRSVSNILQCLCTTRLHQLLCLLESLWPHHRRHPRPSPTGPLLLFFVWQASRARGARFCPAFFLPFFFSGRRSCGRRQQAQRSEHWRVHPLLRRKSCTRIEPEGGPNARKTRPEGNELMEDN